MKREATTLHIQKLATWARDGRLAILTGAGVSMLPPSSLPSWWEISIGAYRAVAASGPGLQEYGAAVETSDLPPAVLAQYLWDTAGDEYFSSLAILRKGRPNANHRLIAALAEAGLVTDVFTLNFDTLHEQALAERGVQFGIVVGGHSSQPPANGVNVHKLHGTIEDLSTIKATLDQTTTTKGIGPISKQRLAGARTRCHLIVLGYSGGDFFLDLDYLGLMSHGAFTKIIWNVRPGEAVSVEHPLNRLASVCPEVEVCEGTLPDILFQLVDACGLHHHHIKPPSGEPVQITSPTWTPPHDLWPGHLFAKVLGTVGQYDRELACLRWEIDTALNDPSPYRTAWAIGAMAQWYIEHGHREIGREFIKAELEVVRLIGDRFSEAVALNNLAFVHQRERRLDRARSAFEESLKACAGLGYGKHEALVYNNLGLLDYKEGSYNQAITWFEKSLECSEDEFTAIRADALGNIALAWVKLGHADEAVDALVRASMINGAIGDVAGTCNNLRNLGHLLVENRRFSDAHGHLVRAVELQRRSATPIQRIETLGLLGDCYAGLKRIGDAIRTFDEASELAANVDNLYYSRNMRRYIKRKAENLRKSLDVADAGTPTNDR